MANRASHTHDKFQLSWSWDSRSTRICLLRFLIWGTSTSVTVQLQNPTGALLFPYVDYQLALRKHLQVAERQRPSLPSLQFMSNHKLDGCFLNLKWRISLGFLSVWANMEQNWQLVWFACLLLLVCLFWGHAWRYSGLTLGYTYRSPLLSQGPYGILGIRPG